jgi:hypothetical protein
MIQYQTNFNINKSDRYENDLEKNIKKTFNKKRKFILVT